MLLGGTRARGSHTATAWSLPSSELGECARDNPEKSPCYCKATTLLIGGVKTPAVVGDALHLFMWTGPMVRD